MKKSFIMLSVIGFDGECLPSYVSDLLASGLSGVILFNRNIKDKDQLKSLCLDIKRSALNGGFPPPIIAIDEEGGRVQRLKGIVGKMPSMRKIGKKGSEMAFETGKRIGEYLKDLGINTDFAPVMDVDSNPNNPIIGDRAFSSDPEIVSRLGLEFIRGLRLGGVTECVKHFPGHGDAGKDSHHELPTIQVDAQTFINRELLPFEKAVQMGVRMVMTAHCLYPNIDPVFPATLSKEILHKYLRERLRYDGCVISDDLCMKAISDRFSIEESIKLGLEASIDLFLECNPQRALMMIQTMEKLVKDREVKEESLRKPVERVMRLRAVL